MMQKTSFPFEVLIHDDASTDKTGDVIREYQEKYPGIIKPIFQVENQYSKGKRAMNIQFNFPRAKGKYIALCEGDDYWINAEKLQKQVSFLERRPEFVFCSHDVNRVHADGRTILAPIVDQEIKCFSQPEIFHTRFPTLSLLFRNLPLYYTEELLRVFNGDAVLVGLLSSYGRAAHLNFLGASYRVHTGGVYSAQAYLENQKHSIATRKAMIKSQSFSGWQVRELKANILSRKKKSVRYALKRGLFREIFEIVKHW